VGHGGTLDPLATGVLPIAVGKATRLISYLPHRKAYHAKVRFGIQTATDDLEGEILKTCSASALTLDKITPYLPYFLGIIEQIPPQYSAIQRDGKRLYDLARQGKIVEVPSRRVEIFDIQVLGWQAGEFPELDLLIRCGEGTYIRAIARDLGNLLGVGATLAGLIRTESGGMELKNSITLEELANRVESQDFSLTSPQTVLTDLPKIILDAETAQRWCQGQKIIVTEGKERLNQSLRVLKKEDENLLGIGEIIEIETIQRLMPKVVLL
jgi:tRNA pseudouridine55 synthase